MTKFALVVVAGMALAMLGACHSGKSSQSPRQELRSVFPPGYQRAGDKRSYAWVSEGGSVTLECIAQADGSLRFLLDGTFDVSGGEDVRVATIDGVARAGHGLWLFDKKIDETNDHNCVIEFRFDKDRAQVTQKSDDIDCDVGAGVNVSGSYRYER